MRSAKLPDADVLLHLNLLNVLSPIQRAQLHSRMQFRVFLAGELMLEHEKRSKALFWIHEGSVKVVTGAKAAPTSGTREAVLNVRGAGAILGELNAFDGNGHTASVVALEETTCFMLAIADFHQAIENAPALGHAATRYFVDCIRLNTERHEVMALHNVACVLAGQFLQLSDTWGQAADEHGAMLLPFPLTQTLLSGLTGHSRERVSRAVGSFESAGYICCAPRHRIVIRNHAALRQVLTGCVPQAGL